jgi:hypothetical protein
MARGHAATMGKGKETVMKIFSVRTKTTTMAAVAAGGASAQAASTRHASEAREDGARGSGAFASAPDTRSPRERARPAVRAFDGDWSVLIQTREGNCDPAYRYGVRIENGEILNAGDEPVALEGRVAPSGAVRVSVSAGNQAAQGAGRLSRTSGSGSWRGQGSLGVCAGTWVAERRESER